MSYPQPKVSVIILHLKDIPCLVDCIASLNKITYHNYDIITVHNGPKDKNLIDALTPISQHILKIIDTGENIGFTKANNIGIREAIQNDADYILLLNDDTEVSKDFLNILVDAGEKNPDVGMLGPQIYFYNEPQKIWFSGAKFDEKTGSISFPNTGETDTKELPTPKEAAFITGCAVLVKKKTIEKIGLLDERFFIYWEDVDWGLRVKKAGMKNLVIPQSKIWHKITVSLGGQESPIRMYLKTRSRLLFAKLHTPWTLRTLYIKFLRDIAWLFFKSKDRDRFKKACAFIAAIVDYLLGRTGKGPDWLWNK